MKKMFIAGIIIAIVIVAVAGFIIYTNQDNSNENNDEVIQNDSKNMSSEEIIIPTGVEKKVIIEEFVYTPILLRIKVGDSVIWTNRDTTAHSITADDGLFESESLSRGQNYTYTFIETGTYTYHCSEHPGMKAKVIVE